MCCFFCKIPSWCVFIGRIAGRSVVSGATGGATGGVSTGGTDSPSSAMPLVHLELRWLICPWNLRPTPPLPQNPIKIIKGLSYFLDGVALGGTQNDCVNDVSGDYWKATSKSLRIGLAQKSEFSLFGMWSVFGKNWCQPQTLWSLHTSKECLHNCLCQNQNTNNKSESPVLGRSSQSL